MDTNNIKEMMRQIHSGVPNIHPEEVVEYQMDPDEFSETKQEKKEHRQTSSSDNKKNRLDFNEEEIN